MNPSVRFRHVHEITGIFVLLAVLLLVAGVLAAGRAQRWFERQEELRTRFPAEGTFGLQPGAEVHILGTPVGTVRTITVDDQGAMEGLFRIRGEFARFIRTDSVAVIKKKFGVAGDSFVEITVGTGAPLVFTPETYIPSRKDTELTEMAGEILDQLQIAIIPAIEELENLMAAYRRLGDRLESQEGDLQKSISHVESLLAGLDRGEGTAGRLLKDPATLEQVEGVIAQVSGMAADMAVVLKQVQGILEDVAKTVEVLPEVAGTVRSEMRDVPGLVLQTRATLRETEILLTGVQRHWLLRKYMESEDPVAALSIHELAPPAGVRP
ncbi:MAG: MlaD family protein [Kiritimatiellia bacterium]|nr:MlaD family protein [Kiritimatiellia bacterium]